MNKRRLFGLCAIFSGLILVIVGLSLLLQPAQYQAMVEIEIEPDYGPGPASYDPYFIETEFIAIKSDVVLSNVVQVLKLDVELGKRYAGGEKLSSSETIELLRRRIDLENYPNTRLIGIQIRDENPDEAARIANAIAEAYGNYREMEVGIRMLKRRYRDEGTDIMQTEANLKVLEKESIVTNSHLSNEISLMKVALNELENHHRLLWEKIEAGRPNAADPSTAVVTIITPAEPPTTPAGPNRWLGAACLISGLMVGGYGLFWLCAGKKR